MTSQDILDKVESKSSDLMRQVQHEHSERMRYQDYLIGQIDLKSKIADEKLIYHKEELRESTNRLETSIQSAFKKRDDEWESKLRDLIKHQNKLQNTMEADAAEAAKRMGQIEDVTGHRFKTIETNMAQMSASMSKECENIGEIIKQEVNARFSSDV